MYVTESHEARAGGIPTVVDQLARQVSSSGVDVRIVSVGDNPLPAPPGVTLINARPAWFTGPWRWSWGLRQEIETAAKNGARSLVLHLHGIWLASQWHGARIGRRKRVPTILSVHGQLEPYHWRDRGVLHYLKKRVYWSLMAHPAFHSVRVIHAITPQEKEHLGALFKDQEIALIPNAVDLDEIDGALATLAGLTRKDTTVAFLGRFHPKKGVDLLIRAFGEANLSPEWRLVLAGPPGAPAFMKELADLTASSHVGDRITFIGPLFGEAKWRFYQSAAVVAVPSRSEVIGMVNLEAAACGTPTITTFDTGLLDWESGGGILIRPEVRDLAQALNAMCSASTVERGRRSLAARRLVENRYSWTAVKESWLNLYNTVI